MISGIEILAKKHVLRNPTEFRRVYTLGKRYDSPTLTALFLLNDSEQHRLGVTVSRKYSRSAVKRNRAKRLLRETFRGNEAYFSELKNKYDWVLLPRKNLADVKIDAPLADFKRIIEKVANKEAEAAVLVSDESSGKTV